MKTQTPRVWPRVVAFATGSIALWGLSVGLLAWYLPRMVAEEYRTGVRTSTDGDSIGLPVSSFAILLGGVLVVANALAAVVLRRRRRARAEHRGYAALSNCW